MRNFLIDVLIFLLTLRTLVVLLVVLGCYGLYVAYPIVRAIRIDKELNRAVPYQESKPGQRSILVLGDSTAVGVGAAPEESVAGRLAQYFNASVENLAKSGAVSADVEAQARRAKKDRYDIILVQAGANDIIRFRNLSDASASLAMALEYLKEKSGHVVVLTSGDIGGAPIFRWPLSWLMTSRTDKLRDLFKKATEEHGGAYLDILAKPDIFSGEPQRYYAEDGLHLSGEGYRYWYELVLERMNIWPELAVGRVL